MTILPRLVLALLALMAFAWPARAADPVTVNSPDGRISFTLSTDGEGSIQWSVTRGGASIVAPSRLGFLFTDADPLGRGMSIVGTPERNSVDSRWDLPWGERKTVTDRHNELLVRFKDQPGSSPGKERVIGVRVRVFDNGVAFRTEFPDGRWNIAQEKTEFAIGQGGTAWWIQGGDWNRYEYLYQTTPIDAVSTAHTPITMKLADGTHIALHEAALVDYAGMWLKRMDGRRFVSNLSPSSKGPRVARIGPFTTPWRSIRIADSAGGLYDNDLELNLNEPNKLGEVSWVKPYKYVGVWWEMHLDTASWASGPKHGATTANTKRHIDFAAKHGFRGVLVEGWNKGWDGNWFANGRDFSFTQPYPDFDIEWLSKYGLKKGVHLVGHHETGGNIAVYEAQLEDAMAFNARLGIDSVKTGYVADAGGIIAPGGTRGGQTMEWHDGQRMAVHHLHVVQVAARNRIAVNPHEPIKDTGLRRTYPNWVAREGARGSEYDAWGEPKNIPSHVPTLYFTRMLSGPMDYTPGIVSLKGRGDSDLPSTLARQLALYLVVYSPIQMAADLPENYEKAPDALAFIKQVPVDWSETRTLGGAVGEHVLVARKDKASEDWYVGAVTNEEAREVSIDLSFLPAGKRYTAHIWRDGDDADYRTATRFHMVRESKAVRGGETMRLRLAPGGGFAVRLTPAR